MRISLSQSGGVAYFPGLSAPRTVDLSTLSEADRQELRELVEQAEFFRLPALSPTRHAAPNCLRYTLSISDQGREHAVCIEAPAASGALEDLVRCVRRHVDTPST